MTLSKCDKCRCSQDVTKDQTKEIRRTVITRVSESIITKDLCQYCYAELTRFLDITK